MYLHADLTPQKTYHQDELIVLIRERNQKAFAYLYDNYSKALYGVINNIVNDQEESEDVLQNTFLKIWNHFDSYDASKGRLYTWMLNISRNLAIDCTRSKHEKIKNKIQEPSDSVYHKNKLFVEDKTHESIGLRTMVDNLNKDQREIIDLAYYQGYTQDEIAKKLSLPLGTVKTKVRQALLKLREVTKEDIKQTGVQQR
ncbi:MAG: sigma-70 family RNA polymerase sigma factor [Bacteroidota bacterium]